MEIKKKETTLFYAIAGLVLIWFISRVVLNPFHEKLATLSREVALQEAKLKKGISLIEKKEAVSKEYDKYASFFSIQNYSDEESVANFLKEMEKISRETNLTILDMKPLKEAVKDKFSKEYQINIKAEADMKQLVSFLYALTNSSLLFSVEKMILVPKSEESSDLSITMTVNGVSFL
jgi:hypothetical protein